MIQSILPWLVRPRLLPSLAAAALAAVIFATNGCARPDPGPGPIQIINNPGFARDWATNLQIPRDDKVTEVYVRGSWVFVYTRNGYVYGIQRSDGTPKISVKVQGGDGMLYPPIVLKELLVFPTTSTLEIYSFDGVKQRSLDVGAAIRAECIGDKTTVVFVPVDSPDGGARIKKYDVTSTANIPVWELQSRRGGLASAPALQGDIVYMATDVGTVYAVNEERNPVWAIEDNIFNANSPVVAALKADDAGLYICTLEGKFYCVNRTTAKVKWQWYATGPLELPPVPLADTVYVFDPNMGWAALDKLESPTANYNRKARWVRKDISEILSQDQRYTYARTRDNHLVALDKATGDTKFQSSRSNFYKFAQNAVDSRVYVCSERGRLLAVQPIFEPGVTGEVVKAEPILDSPLFATEFDR